MISPQQAGALFLAAWGAGFPGPTQSREPLDRATWVEVLGFTTPDTTLTVAGANDLAPEPLTGQLDGAEFSLLGEVEFGPTGPPLATVSLKVRAGGGNSGTPASAVRSEVTFQFRLAGPPDLNAPRVPVDVHLSGSASTSGVGVTCEAVCASTLVLSAGDWSQQFPNIFSGHQNFDIVRDITLGQWDLAEVTLVTAVEITGMEQPSERIGEAMANIAIDVQVSDVPMTPEGPSFRDFYRLELSEGYWALGAPTAVDQSTWGELKVRYLGFTPRE